jgi:hypothetical protein
MLEVPFYSAHPLTGSGRYRPISIGQAAATCPTRSYWWLALAFGLGAAGAWQYAKGKKKGRR